MTDLVSGQVDLLVVQGAVALPQVRAGTIKAIANLSPKRSASMPDIPTSDEAGVPGFICRAGSASGRRRARRRTRSTSSTARRVEVLADPAVQGEVHRARARCRARASSRRRKASPHSRRPRSRSGGRSSRRRISGRRRNNKKTLSTLEERFDFLKKLWPSRFARQQDVVFAVQRDETCIGN